MAPPALPASRVCFGAEPRPAAWVLPEEPVPESTLHAEVALVVYLLLAAWAERTRRPARAARNLALRWLEGQPGIGLDPDVALYEPAPPAFDALASVRTWQPGHTAPRVALEVVKADTRATFRRVLRRHG